MTNTASPGTLAPRPSQLPDVLPTDRLFRSGKAKPGINPALRLIDSKRNAVAVLSVYTQIVGSWFLLAWIDHPLAWIAMLVWSARCISLLSLLNHEAVHALLFGTRALNDNIGRYGLAPFALTDFDAYRRAHLAHHKEELGPNEPDVSMYAPYPSGASRLARRLVRDVMGVSGFKLFRGLLGASRTIRLRVGLAQSLLFVLAWAITGHWWAYVVVWFVPWLTVWQLTNRLRAISEHAGMRAGEDRRLTTHVMEPGHWASFMLAPYQSGYHLAHHVDTSVPWNQLRALHTELRASGWVPDELIHRNYRSVWRYLATNSRD